MEQTNERERFYNKVTLWVAFGPMALVFGLTVLIAWFNPSMFGF